MARIGDTRNAYKILVDKLLGEESLRTFGVNNKQISVALSVLGYSMGTLQRKTHLHMLAVRAL